MAHRCCIQGIVAILLFYGADSHQTCRQYRNYNAFDYLLNFRPYREYGIYYFGATLFNSSTNNNNTSLSSVRTANFLAHAYPQDQNEPLGADVNALMPDMEPRASQFIHHPQDEDTVVLQTALMYAADNMYPYRTRWLLRGRRAKVNASSLLIAHHNHHHHDNLGAMHFALKRFPTITTITAAFDAEYHD